MSEHTLLLCPFGHASRAEAVKVTRTPKHGSQNQVEMSAVKCLTCGRTLIHEDHTSNSGDFVKKNTVVGRRFGHYFYSDDDTWQGTGLMFVDVEDGVEYAEPVPTGQAYNEMVDALNGVG